MPAAIGISTIVALFAAIIVLQLWNRGPSRRVIVLVFTIALALAMLVSPWETLNNPGFAGA
jgi:predicted membrane channel-forming protein YqfA (hemolysin III family)